MEEARVTILSNVVTIMYFLWEQGVFAYLSCARESTDLRWA